MRKIMFVLLAAALILPAAFTEDLPAKPKASKSRYARAKAKAEEDKTGEAATPTEEKPAAGLEKAAEAKPEKPAAEPQKPAEPKAAEPHKAAEPKAAEPKKPAEPKAAEPKKPAEPKAVEAQKAAESKVAAPKTEDFLKDGEKLVYMIKWTGLPAGEISMEVNRQSTDPGKAFIISLASRSNKMLGAFYTVKDDISSLMDTTSFRSVLMNKNLHEGNKRAFERMSFLYDKGQIEFVRHNMTSAEAKVDTTQVPTEGATIIHDPLSVIFFLRTLDFVPGEKKEKCVKVFNRGKIYDLSFTVYEESLIHSTSLGTRNAIRIEPAAEFEGVFLSSGRLEMWLDKVTKIPIRIKVEIPVGWATAELVTSTNPEMMSQSYRQRRQR